MIAARDVTNEADTIIVTAEPPINQKVTLHDLSHDALVSLCIQRKRDADELMNHLRFLFPACVVGWGAAVLLLFLVVVK